MNAESVLFYLYAGLAVAGAVGLVAAKRLIHGVMSLFATLFAVAALFLLAGSQFLAAMQLFVYGGAVTVLVLFVLMLTDEGAQARPSGSLRSRASSRWIAAGTALALFGGIAFTLTQASWPEGARIDSSTEALAETLFSRYVVPFEIAGLILTVALIGAIALARDDDTASRVEVTTERKADVSSIAAPELEGAGEHA